MYSGSEVQRELVPLSTLHMMTSSHSLFLPTMLECDDEPGRCQAKGKSGVEQTGGIKHETKKKHFSLNTDSFISLSFQKL